MKGVFGQMAYITPDKTPAWLVGFNGLPVFLNSGPHPGGPD
jgi:hypothetical protein